MRKPNFINDLWRPDVDFSQALAAILAVDSQKGNTQCQFGSKEWLSRICPEVCQDDLGHDLTQ
jgi:hypothetical protein